MRSRDPSYVPPPPRSPLARPFALVAVAVAVTGCVGACAARPLPPPAAPTGPAIPLERICQEALPIPERTVGALVRLLRRSYPRLVVEQRPCHAATEWPIAYAADDEEVRAHPGQSPVGFAVLKMEGDALLTFDARDRDSPTVNLCQDLELRLDEGHRVRAVALWESSDERAFDPAALERSTALLAWVELLSTAPSACALGHKEAPGHVGDAAMEARLACARLPLVLVDRRGCDAPSPARGASAKAPVTALKTTSPEASRSDATTSGTATSETDRRDADAIAVEAAAKAVHRHWAPGREQLAFAWSGLALRLERPELCLYEPAPATHDVCLAEYLGPSGTRWYGRGDVTRTGTGGVKNYVDSYLTFQLLRRIEAERKSGAGKSRGAASPAATRPGEK